VGGEEKKKRVKRRKKEGKRKRKIKTNKLSFFKNCDS
jgi:hypothetical protein